MMNALDIMKKRVSVHMLMVYAVVLLCGSGLHVHAGSVRHIDHGHDHASVLHRHHESSESEAEDAATHGHEMPTLELTATRSLARAVDEVRIVTPGLLGTFIVGLNIEVLGSAPRGFATALPPSKLHHLRLPSRASPRR